jgi:hypothetical protein
MIQTTKAYKIRLNLGDRLNHKKRAQETLDHVVEKILPHLKRISMVLSNKCKLTLLVQFAERPGCVVLGNHSAEIPGLIKALEETAEMERKIAAGETIQELEEPPTTN